MDADRRLSMLEKGPFRTHFRRLMWLFSGLAFVGVSLFAAFDYLDSHSRPHEHVTVTAQQYGFAGCGRYGSRSGFRVTWHSADPPPGLPADFTQDTCTDYDVGYTTILIRRHQIDGSIQLEVAPRDTIADEVILVILLTPLVGVPLAFLLTIWRVSKEPRNPLDAYTAPSA